MSKDYGENATACATTTVDTAAIGRLLSLIDFDGTSYFKEQFEVIFISYSRTDLRMAKRLFSVLQASGHFCAAIWPGHLKEDWRVHFIRQLERCDMMIFLLSPESVRSPHCLWELQVANALRVEVIFLRAGDALDTHLDEAIARRLHRN